MTITLSKTETTLLLDAAGRGGSIVIPDATKPATRQRLIGRFERDGLIQALGDGHTLTPAGYRAVGLRPPRAKQGSEPAELAEPRGTKNALVRELLGRGEGASLAELQDATGWLPHTTRAALSRIRSSGKPLAKGKRDDVTVYRILAEEPAPARRTRKPRAEAASAAAA